VAVLQGREFKAGTPEFGEAFDTYLMHELKCFNDYISGGQLSYWRSTSGFEVDFIIGDHTALEVKAKKNLSSNDIKPLRMLAEEG
jgi:predicted AAA+ superfamily ATPase